MRRKVTKQSRGPNAYEGRFHTWAKQQPCIVTGTPGPSILHHCYGQTFRHNKTLIGHWFVLPFCPQIDDIITHGSRRAFRDRHGPQSTWWLKLMDKYTLFVAEKRDYLPPLCVVNAITDWGR